MKPKVIAVIIGIITAVAVAAIVIPQAIIMKPSTPVQSGTQVPSQSATEAPAQSGTGSSVQSTTSLPASCQALENDTLPDPSCTPGATYPDVTQSTIESTICVGGYASTIRPPVSYTEPIKLKLMEVYGFNDSASNYELDHLIPLELGGAPLDVRNLWPEPHYTNPNSFDKDRFENYLHDQVCSGNMDLATAQNEIATNWVKYWEEVVNRNYNN